MRTRSILSLMVTACVAQANVVLWNMKIPFASKSINLPNAQLSGATSAEIGLLTGLTNINVAHNTITGSIPPEVGLCTALTSLNFAFNNLVGTIPIQLSSLSQLETLDLAGNLISGTVPVQIALPWLTKLNLSDNLQLGGELPQSFFWSRYGRRDVGISNTQIVTLPKHESHALRKATSIQEGFEGIYGSTTVSSTTIGSWTVIGDGTKVFVDALFANSGVASLSISSTCSFAGPDRGISQIVTTTPGVTYQLSGRISARCSTVTIQRMRVRIRDAMTLLPYTNLNVGTTSSAYTSFTSSVLISGSITEVTFFVTSADLTAIIDDINFVPLISPTPTRSVAASLSNTPSSTVTPSGTPTSTSSNTATPTVTPTSTPSNSATSSPTPSATPSKTPSSTPSCTGTPSQSPSVKPTIPTVSSNTPSTTAAPSDVPTNTLPVETFSISSSASLTSSLSDSMTQSLTQTLSQTNTQSSTASVSQTPTLTRTESTSQTTSGTWSQSTSTSATTTSSETRTSSASSSQSTSQTSTPSPSLSASVSPSAIPSLIVNDVLVPSAIKISVSLDANPGVMLISTTLTLSLSRPPLRPLSSFHVYATSGGYKLKTVLLASVALDASSMEPERFLAQIELKNIDATNPAGVLVIGVESESEQESSVDYAWVELDDWTPPPLLVKGIVQAPDADDAPFIVTAVVTAEIVLDDQASEALQGRNSTRSGPVGARLYLTRPGVDGEVDGVRLLVAVVQPVTAGSFVNFDASHVALAGCSDTTAIESGTCNWSVVVFNKAFEAQGTASVEVADDGGLSQVVAATIVTASVAVVATTAMSTVSSTATAVQAAQMSSASVQGGTIGAASPVVMFGNLQNIAMTGSMQLDSIPKNYRSFAMTMAWTNGNLGITKNGQSKIIDNFNLEGHFRTLHSSGSGSTVQYHEAIVAGGSSSSQLLYDALIMFVSLFLVCAVLIVCARRRKSRVGTFAQRLVIATMTLAYYGLTVAAILAVWAPHTDRTDKIVATIVLVVVAVPFPVLGVSLYRQFGRKHLTPDQEASGWDWRQTEQNPETTAAMQSMAGGVRKGYEWYGLLGIYRRLLTAIAIVLLMNAPVVQCGVILAVFVVCFSTNVYFKPFKGGYRSFDFMVEATGQLVVMISCATSLILHFVPVSTTARQLIGQVLVVLEMSVIVGSLFTTLVSIVALVLPKRALHEGDMTKFSSQVKHTKLTTYESPRSMRKPVNQKTRTISDQGPNSLNDATSSVSLDFSLDDHDTSDRLLLMH
eukprot:c5167_g1_i1.p1 GENE.c5167_g1_i1~~c5167_g1_i1.p1  ORF type:complete len:1274 (+),score=210.65 c5167_g1_i1:35-3823(+)